MVVEGFGERDGVEDGDALPGAEGDVVNPTAIGAADLLLGPFVDEEGGFEIFCFAAGVGHAEQRVDGVAATAVDDGAGGTEESAAKSGIGIGGLVGKKAITPGFEELGVEIVLGFCCGMSWGLLLLCGSGENGKGELRAENGCAGRGEL
jgi:hypothetical protein